MASTDALEKPTTVAASEDAWKVHTYMTVYDDDVKAIDGSRITITETVAPDHKLLSQACSSRWVEGKSGPGQCLVSSMLMHGAEMIKYTSQEKAVPEWKLLKQSELAAENEGRQDIELPDPDPWAPLFAMVKSQSPAQYEGPLEVKCREQEPVSKPEVESRILETPAQDDVAPRDTEPVAQLDVEPCVMEPVANLDAESSKTESVAQLDVKSEEPEPVKSADAASYSDEKFEKMLTQRDQNRIELEKLLNSYRKMRVKLRDAVSPKPNSVTKPDPESRSHGLGDVMERNRTEKSEKTKSRGKESVASQDAESQNPESVISPDPESRSHGLDDVVIRTKKSEDTQSRDTKPATRLDSSRRRPMFKILACLFLLLVAFVLLMKPRPADEELEHAFARHHEMVQFLDATKSTGGISEVVRHKAYSAHSIAIRIGDSHLPGKDELSKHIGATTDDMHAVSGELETFRGNVRKMTQKLLLGHEYSLRTDQRVRKSFFAMNRYKDDQQPPTKAQLRKEWNEFASSLTKTLSQLLVKSEEIDRELKRIESSLLDIDGEMETSQEKTEMNYATARDSGWLYWLNIYALPASEYERGIKLIKSFRPEIKTARNQVIGIGTSVGKVKNQLDLVMTESSGKDDTNLESWFGSREVITTVKKLATILAEDKI